MSERLFPRGDTFMGRVAIVGDRGWQDEDLIETILETVAERAQGRPVTVLTREEEAGACGIAIRVATRLGMVVRDYWTDPAEKPRPTKAEVNLRIIERGEAETVIAFHDHLNGSLVTRNMVELAAAFGLPAVVVRHQSGGGASVEWAQDVVAGRLGYQWKIA